MRSFPIFTVLFLVVPIVEIYLLLEVGGLIGAFPTIILVVLTAVIGAGLLRQQGLSTLARLQQNMGQGKIPAQEMIEGVLLAVGGALLMTPGFVTDTMGFLCLLPFSRKFIAKNIMKRSADNMKAGVNTQTGFAGGFYNSNDGQQTPYDPNIVEGEFTEVEDSPPIISPTNKK